jgi:hypothetical protein
MSERQAWLTRVVIYFVVWCVADIAAMLVRFGAISSPASMPVWLFATIQLMALLVFVRRDGVRSDARGLLLAVIVANLGIASASFWAKAYFSRTWLMLMIVFALAGLLTTSAALQRTELRLA